MRPELDLCLLFPVRCPICSTCLGGSPCVGGLLLTAGEDRISWMGKKKLLCGESRE